MELKDRILEAAYQLFSKKGYDKTSVADIINVVGHPKADSIITSSPRKRSWNPSACLTSITSRHIINRCSPMEICRSRINS